MPYPNTADYIPLALFPPSQKAPISSSICSRRRVFLAVLFSASVLTFFVLLRQSFQYSDDDDFDDLDVDLFPEATSSLHTSYLPFETSLLPAPGPAPTLKPVVDLPSSCLDAYYSQGDLCYSSQVPKLDFLWTWVNGSDPLELDAKLDAQDTYADDDPWRPTGAVSEVRLYRNHDELRHSLRSVLANFRKYIGHFRLLTSDFPVPATTPNLTLSASWRLGQIPQWLDLGKHTHSGWKDGAVSLDVVHHAQIFSSYEGTNFNSLAIETQLGHVPDISDYFVYMNDDLYMMRPMTPASFYTSAYGIVLHMEAWLKVPPSRPTHETMGEWRGMGESNYMLSERFGARERPYVMHQAKIVSSAMLAELETIWPGAFARSSSHRFRETSGPGAPSDINTLFLHAHFIVERAREALLWAWVVGRLGALDDSWGAWEGRTAWEELGGEWEVWDDEREMDVRGAWRSTLERKRVERALARSGVKGGLGSTSYVFSSMDGYAYADLGDRFQSSTPDVPEDELPTCRINYDQCFAGFERASDVFKHIAFKDVECGDCVISALVRESGDLGNAAFLPHPARKLPLVPGRGPSYEGLDDIPHLPLVERWQDGDFSLGAVMGTASERNLRAWILQLLQRYRYVMGYTPASFERLEDPQQTADVMERLSENHEVVLLCVNDDVTEGDAQVAATFRTFQDAHWSKRATWERHD
ncbi:uncharacterized protein FIBRA_05188 [Fibroporia radiculosa]|uniref:Stealth protein CR3 conserved region 3 domain-containing protein n=1 Tax=Fibroporia radiculosa TaxID=599839 RepID=J4G8R6_9APHY|nr:uncharacterized protein FIBRA_05188 [Fibroporia radiculosa]CCM03068.1 predicted protein [Fibroporia radiculosa]